MRDHSKGQKTIMHAYNNLMKGVFDGELEKPAEVLSWLDDLLTGADIEQVDDS